MKTQNFQPIPQLYDVDADTFRNEIAPQYKPVVLKGLVKNWPSVKHALQSPGAIAKYLSDFDNGKPMNAVLTPPEANGRMFYQDDMNGFNFLRNQLPVSAVIEEIAKYFKFQNAPSVALQCAKVADCIPEFAAENKLPLLNEAILPRIWLGSEFTVATHFDEMDNLACVVSGKRRFTLFPPEQISNLYIGPLEYTPAGAPVSMVDLKNPDFERFPRYKEALAAAQVAELEPGDAIFIPTIWWHHVESLSAFNVLINYWWKDFDVPPDEENVSPVKALFHCLLTMKDLTPTRKQAWEKVFAHYFSDTQNDPAVHIPEDKRGVLGQLSPEQARLLMPIIAPDKTR